MATKYRTVKHHDSEVLDAKVNELLQQGWHLHGTQQVSDMEHIQVLVMD